MVKRLVHWPLRTALSKDTIFDLQEGHFEFLNKGLDELQVKYSQFQLAEFRTIVCKFSIDCSFVLTVVVEDVALDGVRRSRVFEERSDVESTIAYEFITCFEFQGKTGGVFRNLDQENFIDGFARRSGGGVALGYKSKRQMAYNICLGGWDGDGLYSDVQISSDDCLRLLFLH